MFGLAELVLALAVAPASTATPPRFADAEERAVVEPRRFRLRRVGFGFGARAFTDFSPCAVGDGLPSGCGASPVLSGSVEAGTRAATLFGELSTSPVPRIQDDFILVDALRLGIGGSFGNEKVRATVLGTTGALALVGGELRLLVSPWKSKRGHRHGLEVAAGWSWFFGEVTIGYRFMPARLNHRRRAR